MSILSVFQERNLFLKKSAVPLAFETLKNKTKTKLIETLQLPPEARKIKNV